MFVVLEALLENPQQSGGVHALLQSSLVHGGKGFGAHLPIRPFLSQVERSQSGRVQGRSSSWFGAATFDCRVGEEIHKIADIAHDCKGRRARLLAVPVSIFFICATETSKKYNCLVSLNVTLVEIYYFLEDSEVHTELTNMVTNEVKNVHAKVANLGRQNDANLALPPRFRRFRQVLIESPL
ncbi:hypothetical protein TNCV_2898101 [Trichonephila clavipes]|nr:hypothetical protein TNCV_2898101 [Trichonephila clavipes]